MPICKPEIQTDSEDDEVFYTDFVRTLGIHTYAANKLFKENQTRLREVIMNIVPRSVILLKGGRVLHQYDTELTHEFSQESFFYWLFGVIEPDCYGSLDVRSGDVVIYLPKVDHVEDDNMSSKTDSDVSGDLTIKSIYDINKVYAYDRIDDVLRSTQPEVVLLLSGTNGETELPLLCAEFDNVYDLPTDTEILYPTITSLRAIKTEDEINIMKRTAVILCEAIKYIMLRIRPGNYEYQADAIFKHFCYFSAGCKLSTCFGRCTSGPNILKLNYSPPMDRIIESGDLCVLELGTKYCGYASKVTVTYPASGEFTLEQRNIYKAVFIVRDKVLQIIKEGVSCTEIQLYAHQTLLEELKELGLVQGNINDMVCSGVGTVFAPLSLITLIGIDYNDVGGYIYDVTPPPPCERWLSFMKTTRVLEENMVISFCPACYISMERIRPALDNDIMSRFLVKDIIEKYLKVGGVKLEDNILINNESYELITHLPRTWRAIERWLKQPVETYINKVVTSSIFNKTFTYEEVDPCEA